MNSTFNIRYQSSYYYRMYSKYSLLGDSPHITPEKETPSGIAVKTNELFMISDFPNELKDRIWHECRDKDIKEILCAGEEFHDSILHSSWWREQLQRQVGVALEPSIGANWVELYLAYVRQQISGYFGPWRRTECHPDLHSQDLICLTDGYVIYSENIKH